MTVGAVSNLGLGLGSTNYSQLYNDPYPVVNKCPH